MVGKWGVSDDKLTYTFELRDGLKFSDGSAVTAADCVASLRRWAARDGAGQHLMPPRQGHAGRRRQDLPDRAERALRARDRGLAKISTSLCCMMRKKEAETDPNQQIRETVGSGPFLYNRGRDPAGQPLRLRPQPELRAARGAALGHGRRQGGQARPRHLREHRRRADRARGAAGRRDRLLRGAAAGPVDRAREGPEPQGRGAEQDRPHRRSCASTSCIRRSTTSRRGRPCCTSSSRTTS